MTGLMISALLFLCAAALTLYHHHHMVREKHAMARIRAVTSMADATTRNGMERRFIPAFLRHAFHILDWTVPPKKYSIAFTGGFLICAIIKPLWAFSGLLMAFLIFIFMINRFTKKTLDKFLMELPGFINRMMQLIIAGNSAETAFLNASKGGSPLFARMLQPVRTSIAHSMPLPEAVHNQALNLGLQELTVFATILRTNARYGGDLSEPLAHFEDLLNNRQSAKLEMKAMTSEMRMTAVILTLLPIAVSIAVFALNPDYLDFFITDNTGNLLAGYALVSLLVGGLIIKRMATIDY